MKVLVGLLCLLIVPAAQADMLVEKETSLVDPLRGTAVSQETILFRDADFAINQQNSQGLATRTIVHNMGEELFLINYEDLTYSLFDQYLIDSMTVSRAELEPGKLDSVRSMMTINSLDIVMTGNEKDIDGLKAEEVRVAMNLGFMAPVFGERPIPVQVIIKGSQWVASDFGNFDRFRENRAFLFSMPGGITRDHFGDYSRILRIFGADEKKIAIVSDLLTRLMLEGKTYITIKIGSGDEEDAAGEPATAMSWTVKFDTRLINISFDKIQDAEFEIPRGFRKVHNAYDEIGDFIVPSLEKWFALDKRF